MDLEEKRKRAILEQLENLEIWEKLNIYNNLDTYGCYYYDDFDEFIRTCFPSDPVKAAKAVYYGDVNLSSDYFTLDAYENVKSYTESELNSELDIILSDNIDEILKLDDYFLNYFDLSGIDEE